MVGQESDRYLDFHVAFVKVSHYVTMYQMKNSLASVH